MPELLSLDLPAEASGDAFALDLDLPSLASNLPEPALDWQEAEPASESRPLPMSEAEFDSVFGSQDAPPPRWRAPTTWKSRPRNTARR
jgi:hypothetical protein